jgi:hypothetical protein
MSRDRMLAAGQIVAAEARRLAEPWSETIPPSIKVSAGEKSCTIKSAVPAAYPNEVPRVRHPVWGNREVWVTNQYRPFLAPAAEAKADECAAEIAKTIDDFCHDHGFEGFG